MMGPTLWRRLLVRFLLVFGTSAYSIWLPAPVHASGASACPPPIRPPVASPTTAPEKNLEIRLDSELYALIEEVLGSEADHYGVVVRDVSSNTGASLNPDKIFYAASLFKLEIMVETFRQRDLGKIALQDEIVATWDDVLEDLGTFPGDVGDVYTVADLLEMMITRSDNTSAIMLMRTVGPDQIDETMTRVGLQASSVMTEDLPTTPEDMALLLETIQRGDAFGPDTSGEMIDLLLRQTWRSRIPAGIPENVLVGNKTGDWYDAAHDVAIVFAPSGPYILAILSDGEGSEVTIVELSERIYEYYQSCRRPGALTLI